MPCRECMEDNQLAADALGRPQGGPHVGEGASLGWHGLRRAWEASRPLRCPPWRCRGRPEPRRRLPLPCCGSGMAPQRAAGLTMMACASLNTRERVQRTEAGAGGRHVLPAERAMSLVGSARRELRPLYGVPRPTSLSVYLSGRPEAARRHKGLGSPDRLLPANLNPQCPPAASRIPCTPRI